MNRVLFLTILIVSVSIISKRAYSIYVVRYRTTTYTTASLLNVRSGPGLESNIITALPKWTEVRVIAIADVIDEIEGRVYPWFKIEIPESYQKDYKYGWVFGGFLDIYTPLVEYEKLKDINLYEYKKQAILLFREKSEKELKKAVEDWEAKYEKATDILIKLIDKIRKFDEGRAKILAEKILNSSIRNYPMKVVIGCDRSFQTIKEKMKEIIKIIECKELRWNKEYYSQKEGEKLLKLLILLMLIGN